MKASHWGAGVLSAVMAALALAVPVTISPASAAAGPRVAPAQQPPPTYPAVGAGTHFLDQDAKLAGLRDADWYKANIPFLDVPDQQIEQVYYYRWRTWKEHLRYTNPQDGFVSTEFLDCCGYAAPYQAINAAAGHQITEGRWVRDRQYGDDYVRFWLTGPGAGAKPMTDDVNADTSDWAHEYSFWLASAAYQRAQVTGDTAFVEKLLPELERQWHGWDKQYNPTVGLYWSVPVWDAMELSASSYQSSDPYHGGAGYRPTLNSYQYGDAMAISAIATLTGDRRTAREYADRAASLKASMHRRLWDPSRQFSFHVARDNNPELKPLDTREEIGFIPWAFGAAEPADAAAWQQLFDPQGFAAPFGPTTTERRSPWFMHDAGGCCRWDGPSWPFSTSQTLTGMANLLNDYPAQPYVNKEQYAAQLRTYALTQFRNGKPYVAEAHAPDDARWIYDGYNHSEDYNHSTYVDLVINGLMGLRPQTGNALEIQPLTPAGWDHFALENVPYHGHNVTLLYDRDGSHYNAGTGLQAFIDGQPVARRDTVGPLTVQLPKKGAPTPDMTAPTSAGDKVVNDAANPLRSGFPKPITSYTWRNDDPWSGIDGKVWFDEVPENTRWTNYSSPNANDWYGVDLGAETDVSDVRFYGYDDGGGVRAAAGYALQYWTGSAWAEVPGQVRASPTPVGNGLNRITFAPVRTSRLRLVFDNPRGAFVGVTELQAWSPSSTRATVQLDGPKQAAAGPLTVVPGLPTTVTTSVDLLGRPARDVHVELRAPVGWLVQPLTATEDRALGAKQVFRTTWRVTAPLDAVGSDSAPLLVQAQFTQRSVTYTTHRRVEARIGFDPALYPQVAVDDGFTADTSANYHVLQPFADNAVPSVRVGEGRLTGSSGQRFFGLLDRGTTLAAPEAAIILDPASFIGASATSEDSLFVGLSAGPGDYVGGWYNNHFRSSGIDVRAGGALNPNGTGNCCAAVTIAAGDRLALQLHGSMVITWAEHDGTWSRLARSDVGRAIDLSDPATLAKYHPMFGLRGDPGSIAVDRFEVRTR